MNKNQLMFLLTVPFVALALFIYSLLFTIYVWIREYYLLMSDYLQNYYRLGEESNGQK